MFFSPLPPTNMYVFIKKKNMALQESLINTDSFEYTSGCRIPRNSKIVVIDFRGANQDGLKCCNDFQIFGDLDFKDVNKELSPTEEEEDELYEIESKDTVIWYQSSYVMKGFKDCIVNGSSVTNNWVS